MKQDKVVNADQFLFRWVGQTPELRTPSNENVLTKEYTAVTHGVCSDVSSDTAIS